SERRSRTVIVIRNRFASRPLSTFAQARRARKDNNRTSLRMQCGNLLHFFYLTLGTQEDSTTKSTKDHEGLSP
ncbi:hypothetical protein ACFL6U_32790, partial [Planctomycetota bacterium]